MAQDVQTISSEKSVTQSPALVKSDADFFVWRVRYRSFVFVPGNWHIVIKRVRRRSREMLLAGTWFSFVNPMGLPTIKQPVVGRVCARPAAGIFC